MTQTFTRFLRMVSALALIAVCTTRLGATPAASNLVSNGVPTAELTSSAVATSPSDNTGIPGVGPTVNLTPVHALCYGAKNGSVSASVIGDGPFTFAWSNGKTTQNIANVGAGTYTVTVTDVDGDTSTASTSVNQPASIVAYVNCTKVCPGQCNGFATIVVLSGGTAPYTFQWSNGGTTTSITGLCPGVYWVTITDAIGCKKIVGAAVVEGTDVSVSGTTTNGTCADPCAGTISQTVSGAHAPYTYDWSDGANTKNRSGLCAGVYSVTVTSANGCTASATYTITAPTPVNVDVTVDNPACPGETGFASAIVSGGTAPFSFIWSNGSTAADLSGLNGGTYCVTLTDATGCTATDCGDIVDALGFSVTVDSTTCNPWPGTACAGTAAITANGGAAPYTYLWSNGSTGDYVTNLCTGTHSVVVTDNNGCTASTTVMVDVCPPVPCIPPITIVGSPVCGETSVTLSVVGGFNPATAIYAWTQAGVAGVIGTDATLEVTADGTYFVEVSDSITPCISDTFTTVTFIPNPTVSVDVTSVSCFGGENGSVSAIVSGGTAPYVYNWSTGGSSADASGLAAGIYCVTVIDANGCTATACGDVSEPSALNIDINGENGTCTNPCGGSVSVFANGGTAPYSYEWTGGLTTSSAQGLCAGEYCVTVIDTNGCSATGCVTIIAPAGISINVTSTNPTCYGKTNGSASVAVIGGTAPFSYNWSNGSTNASLNNIGAGSYSVTVTDANGCTAEGTANLVAPPKIIAYVNCIKTCPGQCTGTANLTVIGGTAPYTYQWSNGETTQNLTGLCAGIYWVTITDANGCIKIVGAAVLAYPPIVINGSVSNILCAGACSGSITIGVTGGGFATYTYLWSNGSTAKNQSNLCSGEYCVTVTSLAGCTATACFEVTSTPPVTVTVDGTSPLCAPGSGSATANVSGGTAPFSFIWSNGSTLSSINGLAAGMYCVSITDANGCTATACTDIAVPEILTVTVDSESPLCAPGFGSASAATNGGTGAYAYNWSNGATTSSISGLGSGTYCVTVTDANGCTVSDCVVITVPTLLVVDVDANDQLCFGDNTGSVTSSVSGGTPLYTYAWSNGATTADISGLAIGIYTLVVTDANGCTAADLDIVGAPLPLVAVAIPLPATCFGYDNGSISLSVLGGTAPYTYSWSNGATTEDLSGLVAGTYAVTVTDAHNCTATATATVLQPTEVVATATSTNVNCYGACNGTASVSANGGTTIFNIYDYEWSNGSTSASISGLCAGMYTVTVTDLIGCFDVVSVTITEPTELVVSADGTDVTCPGYCDGAAMVAISGGTPGYSVNWSNGAVGGEVMQLCEGTYTFTVTDANGCTAAGSVTIGGPEVITVVADGTDLTCYNGFDGSVTVVASGGTGALNIVWEDGSTDWSIFDLAAGTYCFTVTDANGCSVEGCETITEPEQLLAYSECPVLILCPGDCTGIIEVTVVGGTPPYSYEWSDGATTEDRDGLCAGFYGVTITDANGCMFELLHVLDNPAPLMADANSTDVTCFGLCNGTASVSTTGGTGAVTIAWDNGSTDWSLSELCAGTYCFTVTDFNGCTYSSCVTIEQPELLTVTVDGEDVLCPTGAAAATGSASAVANGGTTAYSYNWSNGATTSAISGLASGTYCVTVTDANGCTATDCVEILAPTPLVVDVDANDLLCFDDNSGSVFSNVFGGTAPYSYNWSNGATTSSISNLAIGIYSLTVTDANGCTAVDVDIVAAPLPLVAVAVPMPATCFGYDNGSIMLTVAGGTAPYSFNWSNGATTEDLSGLVTGVYSVTVTDANGCTATAEAEVIQPSEIVATANSNNVNCYGACNGTASVSAVGGTTIFNIYQYAWSNGATSASISGLCPGVYTVTVTDFIGCSDVATVTITEPAELTVDASNTDLDCYGDASGTASAVANGGTGAYTFVWSNGATGANIGGLSGGVYCVTVYDANQCSATACVTVEEPTELVVSADGANVTCPGLCDGSIALSISGGTPGYTVTWSASTLLGDNVTGLCEGTYGFTVTDANGCTAAGSVTITAPEELGVEVDVVNILCAGDGNGEVTVTAFGGTPAYTINWSNGATDFNIGGLVPGEYCFTVTDANGCTTDGCASIAEPEALVAFSVCPDSLLCPGSCDGSILVTVLGGVPPYTFNWNDGATTEDRFNLCPGQYDLTITDANGCEFFLVHFIGVSDVLEATLEATPALCQIEACTGTATVTVTGGAGALSFLWSNGATTATATELCGEVTYTVTVTDENGCTVEGSVEIPCVPILPCIPDTLDITTSIECGQESAVLVLTGFNPAGSILWNNGSTTASIEVFTAGSYAVTVTVIDLAANTICTSSDSIAVAFYEAPTASSDASDVTCYNGSNGAVVVGISGGTPPYTINWSNGGVGGELSDLEAGVYCYTVTDANGCTVSGCDTVNEPEPLLGYVDCPCPLFLCPGECTGSVNLTVVGGVGPFSFNWSNGATTEDLENLCAGFYEVTITDANGCTFEVAHAPFVEAAPIVVVVETETPSCNSAWNGSISLNISGGSEPYTVNWTGGYDGATIENLVAGTYCYTVTDANGCTAEGCVTVDEFDALLGYVDCPCPLFLCPGECTGVVNLTVVGGLAPYTFDWTNGATTEDLDNLCAGFYGVTITDANGCTVDVYHAPFEEADSCDVVEAAAAQTAASGRVADDVMVQIVDIVAYPNPFAANSTIEFTLPNDDNVTLEVYSVTGQKVAELFRGNVDANVKYTATLDGARLADGMYIYRLVTSGGAYTGNLVRVKD